jgi:hypothetical protein
MGAVTDFGDIPPVAVGADDMSATQKNPTGDPFPTINAASKKFIFPEKGNC